MKKGFLLLLILLLSIAGLKAQAVKMDTIMYNGSTDHRINIVIMGDGYTSTQQAKFVKDAGVISNYLFSIAPWKYYKKYFNVFAIEVISVDSGAAHPNTVSDCASTNPKVPKLSPKTYFGCSFDNGNTHRAIVTTNIGNVATVLSDFLPEYDVSIVLSNSPYYGGTGGDIATFTTHTDTKEIMAHEMGHTFGKLADEYWAGDFFAGEKVNLTKDTNRTTVKWANWYGYKGVGIYKHCCGGTSALWYKPHNNCKMQVLGPEYCSVCTEALIEVIHKKTNPLIAYSPVSSSTINAKDSILKFKLTELILPQPNTLKTEWKLDGKRIVLNKDSIQLLWDSIQGGDHKLIVTLEDTSLLLRVNKHSSVHFSAVSWNIHKSTAGIDISADNHKIIFSVFPNPASEFLNISIESDKNEVLNLAIVYMDGKIISEMLNETMLKGKYFNALNIENLPKGIYSFNFKIGDLSESRVFIKE